MRLEDLQRIRKWHVAHRHTHPVEGYMWDVVLTLWVMGWVGWLPTCMFELIWCLPLCVFAVFTPGLYVTWRLRAHRQRKLRCDWSYAAIPATR
jgi:hypothetical protein